MSPLHKTKAHKVWWYKDKVSRGSEPDLQAFAEWGNEEIQCKEIEFDDNWKDETEGGRTGVLPIVPEIDGGVIDSEKRW